MKQFIIAPLFVIYCCQKLAFTLAKRKIQFPLMPLMIKMCLCIVNLDVNIQQGSNLLPASKCLNESTRKYAPTQTRTLADEAKVFQCNMF